LPAFSPSSTLGRSGQVPRPHRASLRGLDRVESVSSARAGGVQFTSRGRHSDQGRPSVHPSTKASQPLDTGRWARLGSVASSVVTRLARGTGRWAQQARPLVLHLNNLPLPRRQDRISCLRGRPCGRWRCLVRHASAVRTAEWQLFYFFMARSTGTAKGDRGAVGGGRDLQPFPFVPDNPDLTDSTNLPSHRQSPPRRSDKLRQAAPTIPSTPDNPYRTAFEQAYPDPADKPIRFFPTVRADPGHADKPDPAQPRPASPLQGGVGREEDARPSLPPLPF
jgi:hypothetical protein